uniref:SUI1 domain-containing protein n=1 Tax=Electrophorus electricus TaxID=8005 RepID=A0A4W4G8F0_ELEEL
MSAIQNLQTFDPFADATKGDDRLPAGTEDYIHIRIQQRNGRKTLTTVQGIADDYDKKKLVKAFKKVGCPFIYSFAEVERCYILHNPQVVG